MIWLDGMRSDRLGCYGYERPTSPVIDRLAERGLVCERHYSVSNCTIPAYFSIFTGLYPAVHRATPSWGYYDGKFPFLTDLLQRAGYRTIGISNGVFQFSIETGFIRGYDRYFRIGRERSWFQVSKDAKRRRQHPTIRDRLRMAGRDAFRTAAPHRFDEFRASRIAAHFLSHDMGGRRAVDAFKGCLPELAADASRPFFAYVNIPETHAPFFPPASYRDVFGKTELTAPLVTLMTNQLEFERRGMKLTEAETRDLGRLYDAKVRYSDALVGEIVSSLKEHGLYERTVIVLVSDHGNMLYEARGYLGGTSYTYEPEIRVPLVIANLAGAVGRRKGLLSCIDVFPSLLEIAQVDMEMDDRYLCRSVLSEQSGHDAVVCDYPMWTDRIVGLNHEADVAFVLKYSLTNRTLIGADGWKLIWRHDGRHELYDLRVDPAERTDLSGSRRERLLGMTERLRAFYERQVGPAGRMLEVYDHNAAEDETLLPDVSRINPSQRTDAVSFVV